MYFAIRRFLYWAFGSISLARAPSIYLSLSRSGKLPSLRGTETGAVEAIDRCEFLAIVSNANFPDHLPETYQSIVLASNCTLCGDLLPLRIAIVEIS